LGFFAMFLPHFPFGCIPDIIDGFLLRRDASEAATFSAISLASRTEICAWEYQLVDERHM